MVFRTQFDKQSRHDGRPSKAYTCTILGLVGLSAACQGGITVTSHYPPGFVEIPWMGLAAGAGSRPCTVELSDAQGAKMTVQLAGETPVLVALAEAFWRRRR